MLIQKVADLSMSEPGRTFPFHCKIHELVSILLGMFATPPSLLSIALAKVKSLLLPNWTAAMVNGYIQGGFPIYLYTMNSRKSVRRDSIHHGGFKTYG